MVDRLQSKGASIRFELKDLHATPQSKPSSNEATETTIFDRRLLSTGSAEDRQFTVKDALHKEAFDKLWRLRAGLVYEGLNMGTKVYMTHRDFTLRFPELLGQEFGL